MDLELRAFDAVSSPDFETVARRVGGEAQRCLCTRAGMTLVEHHAMRPLYALALDAPRT